MTSTPGERLIVDGVECEVVWTGGMSLLSSRYPWQSSLCEGKGQQPAKPSSSGRSSVPVASAQRMRA
jgi:hypothetical protein